ncbi:MAG TPA: rhomboid family intramembrane serine protease [Phycisphaerales bacterium]|nr:rhomboid family intramembrane serine protease [Phycisphaerales bacterium]
MLLPIRTSIRPRRTPYANYVLIALNVVFFLLTYWPHTVRIDRFVYQEPLRLWAQQFMLHPANAYLWQFVTYAFLHGGLMHILGNMYFLYLFGNNVNDRLGHVGYVCLYLAGAVFAGIGHMVLEGASPVLGASGAVAAVTGAYLVLFPRTVITVIYWFYIIGTIELSALYFILFKLIVWDNMVEPNIVRQGVAYEAHLAGYAFGVVACLLMLVFGLLERSQTDLWFMLRQWNRRRRFRDAVSDGYDPYRGQPGTGRIRVRVDEADTGADDDVARLRSEAIQRIRRRDLPGAAETYIELIEHDPDQVLPESSQLDVANQLMSAGRWAEAAQAYDAFLRHYPEYAYIEQVHLMLGVLYGRYLNRPEQALEHLRQARDRLTDPGQIRLCQQEIARLEGASEA